MSTTTEPRRLHLPAELRPEQVTAVVDTRSATIITVGRTWTPIDDPAALDVIRAIQRRVRHAPRRPPAGYPLLRGVLVGLGGWAAVDGFADWEERYATIAVWCAWCRRWHWHGWAVADNGRVVSHRCAHCGDGSPMHEKGYYIGVLRTSDPGYSIHAIRPGTIQIRRRPEARRATA